MRTSRTWIILPLGIVLCLSSARESLAWKWFGAKLEEKIKKAGELAQSAKSARSLDEALEQLRASDKQLSEVAASKVHLILASRAREARGPLQEDLQRLEAMTKDRDKAIELVRRRQYEEPVRILNEMVARAPQDYKSVIESEVARLRKEFEERKRAFLRWVDTSRKLEEAFSKREEFRFWRKVEALFPVERADELVAGYAQGYDNPEGKTPHYKLGWLAGALGKSSAEAAAYFAQAAEEPYRSLGFFFLGLHKEEEGDFLGAERAFSAVTGEGLPAQVADIAKRRVEMYATLNTKWPNAHQQTEDFFLIVDKGRRLSPLGEKNTLDRELYPQASAKVSEFVRQRFDKFLELDWAKSYKQIGVLYRQHGNVQLYTASTPREKELLEPPLKLLTFMLFEDETKGIDFLDPKMKAKYDWFRAFLEWLKPGLDPEVVSEDLRQRLQDAWGRDLKYFEYARAGRWPEAISSLRATWREKQGK